jgi:4-carboxymuconolactone decarboxylase
MRLLAGTFFTLLAASVSLLGAPSKAKPSPISVLTPADVRHVAPALEGYTQSILMDDLWKRPGLSPRDRSIITLAALISRNQTTLLPTYLNLALDHGVKPSEISGIITHLAFYSGWGNAISAEEVTKGVFARRKIKANQLPPAGGPRLSLDEAAEAQRAAITEQSIGPVFPGLVRYTNETLFHELWLRPDLTPRDRSLVTVSALIALGAFPQLTYHLNRALDHGLTQEQASEVITHLAFYAGWPCAVSAVAVAKDVFEKRAQ